MINSGDTAFMLVSTALVFLMTPGLAFFYGGLLRKKNVLSLMIQNFLSIGVVTVIWVLGGFSLVFGKDVYGIIGNLQYFGLNGVGILPNPAHGSTVPFLVFFAYQLMFAIITPALITGAFADRLSFTGYIKFLVLWSILVYIPLAHWIWGGGFLAQWGVVDFAGGLVVHASAGFGALASVFFLGKRVIEPGEDLKPHNIAYVALGTGLLWFGWFGFNGGSALTASGLAAFALVNSQVAASVAMIVWLIISWIHEKKPTFVGVLIGGVAGLATITPAAGYVQPWGAAVIGLFAALFVYWAVQIRNKRDWDDALDVWATHGIGGITGTLLIGVLAVSSVNGISGLVQGHVHQLLVQLLGIVIVSGYGFVVTYLILKFINVFEPIRVSREIEIQGLDTSIHGETAYLG